MRIIEKSTKLENVKYEVLGPVLAEAERMISQGEQVIKLNIGNPAVFGFTAPDELFETLMANLRASQAYGDSKGIFSARSAILAYARRKNLPNVTENDIYVGDGVSELISICMTALLNPGDEILIPAPDYPLWTAAANLAGGKVVYYTCDEQADWNPDISNMRKLISSRTKAIVVINPNNPTGALYDNAVLTQIVELAREHGLPIFADEIYDRLIMGGHKHTSIAALAPDMLCITLNGLSKSHAICGYRCGWMILSGDKSGAQDYIDGLNTLTSMRICANVPAQQVIEISLKNEQTDSSVLPGGRLYEQCEYIYRALNNIPGISAVKPKAALYIFPKLDIKKFNIKDDERFAFDYLRQQKVLVVQGTGFNWPQPDHFRIVYLPHIEDLRQAAARLGALLENYHQ
ncbi:MAG: pyridoxal phosphate-dependent aminotransferase [Firmicutes bacterium]|nr:pyridoxal phosphate-dependent aminotransferase [Bacillota bacterium]